MSGAKVKRRNRWAHRLVGRFGVGLLLVAALIAGSAGGAHAQGEIPIGRWGLVAGGRAPLGTLGDQFNYGYILGVNAGYQPTSWPWDLVTLGVNWSVLWGNYASKDPDLVELELTTLEMNFGFNGRYTVNELASHFLFVTGGGTLLRTGIPVYPDGRAFFGPYAGGGWEYYALGKFLVRLEMRYGLIVGGPSSLSTILSVEFGSG